MGRCNLWYQAGEENMNTILLILDALRFDHVNEDVTPNLMRHIENSANFVNAFSCNSSTIKSMPCIICGQKEYDPEKNIATELNKHSVHTAMIHSNPIVHSFYSGFKETIDLKSGSLKMGKGFKKRLRENLPPGIIKQLKKIRATLQEDDAYLPYSRADESLIYMKKWMRENENYFLWAHLMDPHIPYYPLKTETGLSRLEMRNLNDKLIESVHGNYSPNSSETEMALKLYKEDIREMDQALKPFIENLPVDTNLIITADHGEEFGEYGQYSHHSDKNIPELLHVPLIISGPLVKPQQITDYVSTMSISATILDAQGVQESKGKAQSLWNLVSK
jgi:arylsulfatase A-like enzyme